ncbi:hypothetical protein GQR58_021828 [Nymphon striatum]|nr:hypothetical protein GQR58_021828 [Nymphon striatum]
MAHNRRFGPWVDPDCHTRRVSIPSPYFNVFDVVRQYHKSCRRAYFKQCKEAAPKPEAVSSRQLHSEAFKTINDFINTEVIQNNKVMLVLSVQDLYEADYCSLGGREDDIAVYSIQALTRKLKDTFEDKILLSNYTKRQGNFLYSSSMSKVDARARFHGDEAKSKLQDMIRSTALHLRSLIHAIPKWKTPMPTSVHTLKTCSPELPQDLFLFYKTLMCGLHEPTGDQNWQGIQRKVLSMSSDADNPLANIKKIDCALLPPCTLAEQDTPCSLRLINRQRYTEVARGIKKLFIAVKEDSNGIYSPPSSQYKPSQKTNEGKTAHASINELEDEEKETEQNHNLDSNADNALENVAVCNDEGIPSSWVPSNHKLKNPNTKSYSRPRLSANLKTKNNLLQAQASINELEVEEKETELNHSHDSNADNSLENISVCNDEGIPSSWVPSNHKLMNPNTKSYSKPRLSTDLKKMNKDSPLSVKSKVQAWLKQPNMSDGTLMEVQPQGDSAQEQTVDYKSILNFSDDKSNSDTSQSFEGFPPSCSVPSEETMKKDNFSKIEIDYTVELMDVTEKDVTSSPENIFVTQTVTEITPKHKVVSTGSMKRKSSKRSKLKKSTLSKLPSTQEQVNDLSDQIEAAECFDLVVGEMKDNLSANPLVKNNLKIDDKNNSTDSINKLDHEHESSDQTLGTKYDSTENNDLNHKIGIHESDKMFNDATTRESHIIKKKKTKLKDVTNYFVSDSNWKTTKKMVKDFKVRSKKLEICGKKLEKTSSTSDHLRENFNLSNKIDISPQSFPAREEDDPYIFIPSQSATATNKWKSNKVQTGASPEKDNCIKMKKLERNVATIQPVLRSIYEENVDDDCQEVIVDNGSTVYESEMLKSKTCEITGASKTIDILDNKDDSDVTDEMVFDKDEIRFAPIPELNRSNDNSSQELSETQISHYSNSSLNFVSKLKSATTDEELNRKNKENIKQYSEDKNSTPPINDSHSVQISEKFNPIDEAISENLCDTQSELCHSNQSPITEKACVIMNKVALESMSESTTINIVDQAFKDNDEIPLSTSKKRKTFCLDVETQDLLQLSSKDAVNTLEQFSALDSDTDDRIKLQTTQLLIANESIEQKKLNIGNLKSCQHPCLECATSNSSNETKCPILQTYGSPKVSESNFNLSVNLPKTLPRICVGFVKRRRRRDLPRQVKFILKGKLERCVEMASSTLSCLKCESSCDNPTLCQKCFLNSIKIVDEFGKSLSKCSVAGKPNNNHASQVLERNKDEAAEVNKDKIFISYNLDSKNILRNDQAIQTDNQSTKFNQAKRCIKCTQLDNNDIDSISCLITKKYVEKAVQVETDELNMPGFRCSEDPKNKFKNCVSEQLKNCNRLDTNNSMFIKHGNSEQNSALALLHSIPDNIIAGNGVSKNLASNNAVGSLSLETPQIKSIEENINEKNELESNLCKSKLRRIRLRSPNNVCTIDSSDNEILRGSSSPDSNGDNELSSSHVSSISKTYSDDDADLSKIRNINSGKNSPLPLKNKKHIISQGSVKEFNYKLDNSGSSQNVVESTLPSQKTPLTRMKKNSVFKNVRDVISSKKRFIVTSSDDSLDDEPIFMENLLNNSSFKLLEKLSSDSDSKSYLKKPNECSSVKVTDSVGRSYDKPEPSKSSSENLSNKPVKFKSRKKHKLHRSNRIQSSSSESCDESSGEISKISISHKNKISYISSSDDENSNGHTRKTKGMKKQKLIKRKHIFSSYSSNSSEEFNKGDCNLPNTSRSMNSLDTSSHDTKKRRIYNSSPISNAPTQVKARELMLQESMPSTNVNLESLSENSEFDPCLRKKCSEATTSSMFSGISQLDSTEVSYMLNLSTKVKEVENGLLLELEDLKSKMKSIEEQLQNTSKSNDLVKDTESGNDEASSDVEVHSSNYLSENCDISQSKALEDLDNDEIEGSQDLFLSPTCPTPPVRTYNELHSNNSSKAVHITSSELACIFDEDF